MPSRYIYKTFQIDTNRINATQRLENMNTLEEWQKKDVIRIEMCEVSQGEASKGNNTVRTNKAESYMATISYADTTDEMILIEKIESIIFPEGVKNENESNDVEIVFNASKYNRILITNDGASKKQPGGILGNAEKLKEEIDVNIVTDGEAISIVKNAIEKRDKMARYISESRNVDLPEWVDAD